MLSDTSFLSIATTGRYGAGAATTNLRACRVRFRCVTRSHSPCCLGHSYTPSHHAPLFGRASVRVRFQHPHQPPPPQIDRCGEQVRYIIDFYNGAPVAGALTSFHIDARPALDSPGAVASTMYMGFLDAARSLGLRKAASEGADAVRKAM